MTGTSHFRTNLLKRFMHVAHWYTVTLDHGQMRYSKKHCYSYENLNLILPLTVVCLNSGGSMTVTSYREMNLKKEMMQRTYCNTTTSHRHRGDVLICGGGTIQILRVATLHCENTPLKVVHWNCQQNVLEISLNLEKCCTIIRYIIGLLLLVTATGSVGGSHSISSSTPLQHFK